MVCNKLETGFDEPCLAVMYLDRQDERNFDRASSGEGLGFGV